MRRTSIGPGAIDESEAGRDETQNGRYEGEGETVS